MSSHKRQTSPLPIYHSVSKTQMSIARFYGGLSVNGHMYKYNPENDTLELVKKKTAKGTNDRSR